MDKFFEGIGEVFGGIIAAPINIAEGAANAIMDAIEGD